MQTSLLSYKSTIKQKNIVNQPVLYYCIGLPGSGKTSFSRKFAAQSGACYLAADDIGVELFTVPRFTSDERVQVLRHMESRAVSALEGGQSVIYDLGSSSPDIRQSYRRLAAQNGAKPCGIYIKTSATVARERAQTIRLTGNGLKRSIPSNLFDKIASTFVEPTGEDDVFVISGEVSFGQQLKSLRQQAPIYKKHTHYMKDFNFIFTTDQQKSHQNK